VSADEKVGCAGYQALLARSIALFVRHVYYDGPSSLSMLWTLECGDWFRIREREDTLRPNGTDVARSVPVVLTCLQVGEYGTMQAYPRKLGARLRSRGDWAAGGSALHSLKCGQETAAVAQHCLQYPFEHDDAGRFEAAPQSYDQAGRRFPTGWIVPDCVKGSQQWWGVDRDFGCAG
jgi:hypothetical protein